MVWCTLTGLWCGASDHPDPRCTLFCVQDNPDLAVIIEKEYGVQQLLVNNVKEVMATAHRRLAERQQVLAGSMPMPAVPPGQGTYSYQQVMDLNVDMISYLASHNKEMCYPRELALELWDLLVLNAVTPEVGGAQLIVGGWPPWTEVCVF